MSGGVEDTFNNSNMEHKEEEERVHIAIFIKNEKGDLYESHDFYRKGNQISIFFKVTALIKDILVEGQTAEATYYENGEKKIRTVITPCGVSYV